MILADMRRLYYRAYAIMGKEPPKFILTKDEFEEFKAAIKPSLRWTNRLRSVICGYTFMGIPVEVEK